MQRVEYLHREILQQTRCLVVTLDDSGRVGSIDCPFGDWVPQSIKVGGLLPEPLRAVLDAHVFAQPRP